MKRCAFLSMDNLDDFEVYDHLLLEPLKELGWHAEEISWRSNDINWNSYDAVIIRSPWDYQKEPQAFLDVLAEIEQSDAVLENSLKIVKWNIDKTYLRDLESRGIKIVPSLWYQKFNTDLFPSVFTDLKSEEIVIKPTISAGADNTFRIHKSNYGIFVDDLKSVFKDRPFLAQPFMNNITEEGEFSVFFFGDTYSHTILKTPKNDDFRVQEEHGGRLKKVEPEKHLLKTARTMRDMIEPEPLYTRADYVRTPDNTFALMELELIEPSLYFNMDPESPKRFAKAFDKWMTQKLSIQDQK
ncbi:ATP-grasp domain-containing protein [Fodinibius sp. AD559]|uniref:ATP-grasp domain-containing protein n=1 Tax=Fodinibius sp. AD559 TaxID=3424179 RepID=UPI004046DA0A